MLFAALCAAACSAGSGSFALTYYRDGKEIRVPRDKVNASGIENIVRALVAGTTDMLRLHVDDARIAALKQTDTVLEVVFEQETVLQSQGFGEVTVKRIVIPLSGDFVGSTADPVVTIFPAANGYLTGPLRNANGYPDLMKLRELVERSLGR